MPDMSRVPQVIKSNTTSDSQHPTTDADQGSDVLIDQHAQEKHYAASPSKKHNKTLHKVKDEHKHAIETDTKYLSARLWFVRIWTLIGAILVTGVVVFLLNILAMPVSIIIWTLVFVFALRGLVNKLEEKGVNRTLGTVIAYIAMFLVLAGVGFLLFSPMFGLNSQFTSLVEGIPNYINDVSAFVTSTYNEYSMVFENESVRMLINDIQSSLTSLASTVAQQSANGIVVAGSAIANTLMAVGFALVIAFWILMELPALGRETKRLIGPKHEEDAAFFHYTFTRILGGYIKGTLLQCAIIGAACGILFFVVSVPNAAALGGITGVLNIIPIIGPWLGGAIAAIVSVFVSPLTALIALVGTIVIQQFVYTFISPKIMSDSVDVHPAFTFIALMGGSAIGGALGGLSGSLVGMLASIPAVAVAKAVFVYYFEKRTGRHLVAEDGVFFKGVASEGEVPDPMADATSPHPGATASFLPVELGGKGATGKFARIVSGQEEYDVSEKSRRKGEGKKRRPSRKDSQHK